MFERFTKAARQAVVRSQDRARALGHDQIDPVHLLLGVMADEQGPAARALAQCGIDEEAVARQATTLGQADAEALQAIGVDLDAVRREAEKNFGPGALERPRRRRGGLLGHLTGYEHMPLTAAAKKALEQSLRQALALGDRHIGTEHLLLGLVAEDDTPTAHLLQRLGTSPEEIRTSVRREMRRAA